MRRAYVDTPWGQIHYREAGSGPPLVLIHQTADSGAMFTEVFPLLAPHFRVIAPDTPGFGESDRPGGPPGIDGYARFIGQFMDALALPRAHLLGHHSGAAFALQFAATAPQRVDRLVLCGIPDFDPDKRPQTAAWLEPAPLEADGEHLQKAWDRIAGRMAAWATPQQIHRSVVDTLKALPDYRFAYMALREMDIGAAIALVTAPTLLLYGELETYAGRQEELAPLFRDARAHGLDSTTATTMVQSPGPFAQAVVGFLT